MHSVTFGLDRGLWLSLISREGNVLTDVAITSFEAYPAQPRVAAFANGTVGVVWARSGPSPATFMTLVSGTALNEIDVTERQVIRPRMASDGNSILFIFTSPKTGGGTELRYVIVNAAGTIKTADSSLMSGSGSSVFALCRDATEALRVARDLRAAGTDSSGPRAGDESKHLSVFVVRTCS